MTKDQIMAQLSVLVDGYLVANDEQGDGPADTHDFILATEIVFDSQAAVDRVAPPNQPTNHKEQ